MNPLLLTDSYKHSHYKQYPPGTTEVYSYLQARVKNEKTVFFGLQGILAQIQGRFCDLSDVAQMEGIAAAHFSRGDLFNKAGWLKLLDRYEGRLPVEIKAVPEGTVVDTGNVLMTIRNTDPDFYWLTNWLETMLVQVWYPTTVASHSREIKNIIALALDESADDLTGLRFKLHDFGFRGTSSVESAAIGGAAHLVNFRGTDTLPALAYLQMVYRAGVSGFSIPAAEHSTITTWGRDGEGDAYENMLTQYPEGFVAIVIDSYDPGYAMKVLLGSQLKDRVMLRHGTVVVRLDSGLPVDSVLTGLRALEAAFGTVRNTKEFKLLPTQLRVIQGDGVEKDTIDNILDEMIAEHYSADNISFGMGGRLLQLHSRDDYGFAMKASSVTVDGVESGVYKAPMGDPSKNSEPGKKALVRLHNGLWQIAPLDSSLTRLGGDQLHTVFLDGKLVNETDFEPIRERAMVELEKLTAEVGAHQ